MKHINNNRWPGRRLQTIQFITPETNAYFEDTIGITTYPNITYVVRIGMDTRQLLCIICRVRPEPCTSVIVNINIAFCFVIGNCN